MPRVFLGCLFFFVAFALESRGAPPVITAFTPSVRYVGEHETYWFTVSARGSHRLAYHWWHQEPDSPVGHQVPREPGLILNRPRFTVYNALNNRDYNGWYWCVVEDTVTGETNISPRGQLIVVMPPVITSEPSDRTVRVGDMTIFLPRVNPGAPIPIRYRWFFNGLPIAGAVHPELAIEHVRPRHAGFYTCRITTMGGTVRTAPARLTVTR